MTLDDLRRLTAELPCIEGCALTFDNKLLMVIEGKTFHFQITHKALIALLRSAISNAGKTLVPEDATLKE